MQGTDLSAYTPPQGPYDRPSHPRKAECNALVWRAARVLGVESGGHATARVRGAPHDDGLGGRCRVACPSAPV